MLYIVSNGEKTSNTIFVVTVGTSIQKQPVTRRNNRTLTAHGSYGASSGGGGGWGGGGAVGNTQLFVLAGHAD